MKITVCDLCKKSDREAVSLALYEGLEYDGIETGKTYTHIDVCLACVKRKIETIDSEEFTKAWLKK